MHPGMGGQFGVGGELDSLVGGFGGDRCGIGNNERNDKFAPVADNHGVEDVGAGLECVFNGLRSDEFSGRGFQQVLLAVGDEKIVVFVHVADIDGAEPAVFAYDFAGDLGVFVITVLNASACAEGFFFFVVRYLPV